MFRRCRPLVCGTATGVSFGAQHPTGRTACVGCTASPNSTASSSPMLVQEIFILLDKSRLLVRVQLGRHRFRLAMLHAQTMQQRDQARPALVGDAAFGLDPGANLAGCPRQRLGDPGSSACPAAHRSSGTRCHRSQSPPSLRCPLPDTADARCGSCRRPESSTLATSLAAHALVQQHQRVGPPGQPVSHRTIAGQVNQVATRFGVKEAGADHAMTRVAAELIRKRRIRVLKEFRATDPGYAAGANDSIAIALANTVINVGVSDNQASTLIADSRRATTMFCSEAPEMTALRLVPAKTSSLVARN